MSVRIPGSTIVLSRPGLVESQKLTLVAQYRNKGKILHQHGVSIAANDPGKREKEPVDGPDSPIILGKAARAVCPALVLIRE
jgi:hypothetical protein